MSDMDIDVNPVVVKQMKDHECKLRLSCIDDLIKSPDLIKSELSYHQTVEKDWTDYNLLLELLQIKSMKNIVKLLLTEGCRFQNPSKKGLEDLSPLYYAIQRKDMDILKLMLDKTSLSDINHEDDSLFEAICYANNPQVVDFILRAYLQEKINPKDRTGLTPFHIACRFTPDLVEQFLSNGVDINDRLNLNSENWYAGCSPLHFAVAGNHFDTVKLLLDKGADYKVEDKNGNSPFDYACENDYDSLIYLLLKKDNFFASGNYSFKVKRLCFIDSYSLLQELPKPASWSPLHSAIAELTINEVEHLLKNEANVNETDEFGLAPLHLVYFHQYSRFYGDLLKAQELNSSLNLQMNIAKLLLGQGAEVNAADKFGKTLLHYLTESRCPLLESSKLSSTKAQYMQLISLLLEHGADVTIADICGRTVLHCLADSRYSIDESVVIEMCKMFLSERTNIDVVTKLHETPLCLSINNGLLKVSEFFIDQNANVNYSCDDYELFSPLYALIGASARTEAKYRVFKLMLSKGADPNVTNKDGCTILHHIMQTGCDYQICMVISALVEYGAKVDAKDKNGRTPLHVTCSNYYKPGAVGLLDNGADIDVEDNHGDTALSLLVEKAEGAYGTLTFNLFLHSIMNHVNKLKRLGLDVSEKNNKILMDSLYRYYENSDYSEYDFSEDSDDEADARSKWDKYGKKLNEEIEKMKEMKVDENNSLYGILRESGDQMALYVDSSALKDFMESDALNRDFKLYGSWIKWQYSRALKRKKIMESASAVS